MRKRIFLLFLLSFFLIGCSQKRENIYKNKTTCEGFTEKVGLFHEEEQGWLHVMEIAYICDGTVNYHYTGYNVKFKQLDGYTVKVYYPDGKREEMFSEYTTLYLSEELEEELDRLNDFFNEKQYDSPISKKDLEILNLKKLNTDIIIQVFNNAITSETYTKFGPAIESFFKIKNDDIKNPTIQLAILAPYGYIQIAHFEIIYDNNIYLSDLVKKEEATKEQLELYNNLQNISQKMIEKNKLDIKDGFPNLNSDLYNRIFKLMEDFYK